MELHLPGAGENNSRDGATGHATYYIFVARILPGESAETTEKYRVMLHVKNIL
jgi:hypothetical protein